MFANTYITTIGPKKFPMALVTTQKPTLLANPLMSHIDLRILMRDQNPQLYWLARIGRTRWKMRVMPERKTRGLMSSESRWRTGANQRSRQLLLRISAPLRFSS
jgi:hypothetical protein